MVILHFFMYSLFVLLALNCACLGALQYWLGYVCKCEASVHKSTCYCFFTRMKQPRTFPTICSNPCTTAMFKAGSQQLLAVRIANTRTSTVDGDIWNNFFRPADLVPCIACAPTHVQKGFNFELTFQTCKGIRKIIFHVENTRWGIH